MPNKTTNLETVQQFEVACDELTAAILDSKAVTDRIEWLKEKLLIEFERMKTAADQFEVFTESEAAELLKLKPDTLARLRRKHNLPYVAIGTTVRYMPNHLKEICELFEIRPNRKAR